MKNEAATEYWIELSDYDLKVAEGMLKGGYYLYVGFMCHQSVEKMLKAIYVQRQQEVPPYIHKLDKLIQLCGLQDALSTEQIDFIDKLTPLNIQARYPAYKESIYKLIGEDKAKEILAKTGELLEWLRARIR